MYIFSIAADDSCALDLDICLVSFMYFLFKNLQKNEDHSNFRQTKVGNINIILVEN
jgi:hypothetical protein